MWREVITTAIVGTERRSLTLAPPTGQLGDLLSRLNNSDPEAALLSAAASISLYQQLGQLPVKNHQLLPEPCQPDQLPSCSIPAGQHLSLMLLKKQEKLLLEWLDVAAQAGKRVPDYCLPRLLELGRNSRKLRPAILPVLGKRGRWLAAQNPDWDYVVGEDIELTWTTGSDAARQLLLQQLRTQDPAAARERLATVWEQETSDQRLAFIETFQTGLSMDDEPFLEAVLDDRRKEVRCKAAELLAHLPESRLCQRMVQRVRCALILKEKRNRLHLDFTLPEAVNEGLARDGIDSKHPPRLLGENGWRFLQIVAAMTLSGWYEINGKPPSEWIQTAERSEWDKTLVDGWAVAALRQRNPEWAEVLLSNHSIFFGYLIPQDQLIQGLIGILPPEQRDAFFLKLVQSSPTALDSKHPAFSLLCHDRYPWSAELSHAVLEGIQRYFTSTQDSYDWSLCSALKNFAYYMAPSLAPEQSASLADGVPRESSWASTYWAEAINEFLSLLHFRQEMLREFEN